METVNHTATAAKLEPPPGAPKMTGSHVSYLGDAERIGDSGISGGSGDPVHPLRYSVTAASTRRLPSGPGNALPALFRIRVRNESTFPLREVHVAVGRLDHGAAVAVYALGLVPPLKPGKSAWVEAHVEGTVLNPPAVWVLLPPL